MGQFSFSTRRMEVFSHRRPDLFIIAPPDLVARMPGTGPLRRSSQNGRIKAIVSKSRIEAAYCRAPSLSFSSPLCAPVQRGRSNQWTDRCEDQRRRSWRLLSRYKAK